MDVLSNCVAIVMGRPGEPAYDALMTATRGMGPGAFLAVFADVFLFLYVVFMLVKGMRAAKGREAASGGNRRGSARGRKPAGALPGGASLPTSGAEDKSDD